MSVDTASAPDTSSTADAGSPRHARATVRPEKAAAVAELAESFRAASAAVLTEYRGLTVAQVTALRVALGADTTYAVVKNTLTKLAAAEAGLEGLADLLSGPTAVAFVRGDPVAAAKGLRDYARTNPALVVKGGVLEGKALSADEVRGLADLESREVLLARLAGALLASLSQAVYLFNEPLAQAARLAGALQAKAEEDPSVLAGGAGFPAEAAGASAASGGAAPGGASDGADQPGSAPETRATPPETDGADQPGSAPEATATEGVTPAETDTASDPAGDDLPQTVSDGQP